MDQGGQETPSMFLARTEETTTVGEHLTFDTTKCDRIFDLLLQQKLIRVPEGHVIPSAEELKRRKYCKWQHSYSHYTNDCNIFRQQIQSAIEDG